jgi:hypothetical protein
LAPARSVLFYSPFVLAPDGVKLSSLCRVLMSLYRKFGNHLSPLCASLLIRVLSVWCPYVVLLPLIVLSAVQCLVGGTLFCVHILWTSTVLHSLLSCCYSYAPYLCMSVLNWDAACWMVQLQLVRTATVYMSVYRGYRSRVSSGSVVSDYGLDDRESNPDWVKGFFLYPLCPDRLWGPPSLLYNGYRGSFPRSKSRLKRDADHSPPSTAEVVNE